MKFSFPTVVTLITVLVSASAESTFLRGDSMNHEDGTNFNHRALSGDAEGMVKEEETFASKPSRDSGDAEGMGKEEESQTQMPTSQLTHCHEDQAQCHIGGSPACVNCCNSFHLEDLTLTFCGPKSSNCWGKDTYCLPGISCYICCNSWSWYFTGGYCD